MHSKQKIMAACIAHIAKQMATIEAALVQAREAGNNDTKSSAGDKFETTRAMMHFENIGDNNGRVDFAMAYKKS